MITVYRSRYLVPVVSPVLECAAIAVEANKMIDIGPAADIEARYPHAHHHDFGDAIILPPFANAHTHLELSHYQQWAQQAEETTFQQHDSFVDWILRLIRIKLATKLKLSHYCQSWNEGHQLALSTGTGYFGDILSVADLAGEVAGKMEGSHFIEILGRDAVRVSNQLSLLDHCLASWPNSQWGAAPHAPYTISKDLLKQCYRYTASKRLRSTIHLAESMEEVKFLTEGRGEVASELYPFVGWREHLPVRDHLRPLQYVAQSGGLNSRSVLVHGVHLNQDEISQVAQAGCSMVLCPRSNSMLNVGVAPVADYLRAGVPLALGTDSLASNTSLSLWDEMEFAHRWFGGDLSCEKLLHMSTVGGARAIFGDLAEREKIAQLSVGAPFSFQVIKPECLPQREEIYPFLCQGQRGTEVKQLVVNGKIRYDADEHRG